MRRGTACQAQATRSAREVLLLLSRAEQSRAAPRSSAACRGCCVQVTVELKNDLAITGTLHSVDQYMNIKLDNVKVVNEDKFPHMARPHHARVGASSEPRALLLSSGDWRCAAPRPQTHTHVRQRAPHHAWTPGPISVTRRRMRLQLSVRNCFVRGSVVRYVHLPPNAVDKDMLHDATRRQQRGQ